LSKKEIIEIIERIERRKQFRQLQNFAEHNGYIPVMPFLILRKFGRIIQLIGGVFIGLLIGSIATLLSYVILVLMLHLEL
jgi:hypothetical protein